MKAPTKIPKVYPVNDRARIYRVQVADGIHELRIESIVPRAADFPLGISGYLIVTTEEVPTAIDYLRARITQSKPADSLLMDTACPLWTQAAAAAFGDGYCQWGELL
jgi:hypothetical protein